MEYDQVIILFGVGVGAVIFGAWVSKQIARTLDWLADDAGTPMPLLTEADARAIGRELTSN